MAVKHLLYLGNHLVLHASHGAHATVSQPGRGGVAFPSDEGVRPGRAGLSHLPRAMQPDRIELGPSPRLYL